MAAAARHGRVAGGSAVGGRCGRASGCGERGERKGGEPGGERGSARAQAGVEACEAIAKVDGVDVLFVGPNDLGVSLGGGKPLPFGDARLVAARQRVAAACKAAGKACGILCALPEQVATVRAEGFSFVALGSDMGAAAAGIRAFAAALAVPPPA